MSKKIYLCTNNFYTLFGTVSGYPAGAALCHKLMFWQRWPKRPSQDGTAISYVN